MILKLIKLNSVKSTNDEAIKLIRSKKNNQGIVISKKQSNGKGTMGKKWISINGNFFASIFFELKQNMPAPKDFALINPLIIKNILSKYSKFNVKIKWPNDLLIKRKKVCGILQEFIKIDEKSFLIIGIGINVDNSPLIENYPTTYLNLFKKKKLTSDKIYNEIKRNFESYLNK